MINNNKIVKNQNRIELNKALDNAFGQLNTLFMEYVHIEVDDRDKINQLNDLKIKLCKLHNYCITIMYSKEEKELRDKMLFTIELFIDTIEYKLENPNKHEEITQKLNDVVEYKDLLRKLFNSLYIFEDDKYIWEELKKTN